MPPNNVTIRSGRANPYGIKYFYLSNNEKTAVSEVRPPLRKLVSVGKFKLLKEKNVLVLSNSASISGSIEDEIDSGTVADFMMWLLLGFTSPVRNDDKELEYLPYQYFTEYCKRKSLDGIMFRSASIIKENGNYCYVMFNEDDFEFIETKLYSIDDIKYSLTNLDVGRHK